MKPTLIAIMLSTGLCMAAELAPVSPDQEKEWLNPLIPLPHEIAITNAIRLSLREVGIVLSPEAGPIERQAADELRTTLGHAPGAKLPDPVFTIYLGVANSNGALRNIPVRRFERLQAVPNKEQAYVIQPAGTNGLMVSALNAKGIYYGVQTLRQLLEAGTNSGTAMMPLADVVDWPDMEERGLWNNDLNAIPWLATLKINFGHISKGVNIKQRGEKAQCPELPKQQLQAAGLRAFHLLSGMDHLDYWRDPYKVYPELQGKGDSGRNPAFPDKSYRCPCASNPLLASLIADWLESAASQGPRELSVWLSEYTPCQCTCERCLANGPRQYQLETDACIKAWQRARNQYPDLTLRIFFTLGVGHVKSQMPKDIEDAYACLAMLPPEVKVEKVYGGAYKPFHDYAAKGRWVASYDGREPLPRSFNSGLRFMNGEQTRQYVQNLFSNRWSGVYCGSWLELPEPEKGYYEQTLFGFSAQSIAEWGWNVNGRNLRQFITAWVTRQGVKPVEQVVDWIVLMQPIEQRLNMLSKKITCPPDYLTQAKLHAPQAPSNLPTADEARRIIGICDQATALVQASNDPSFAWESMYVKEMGNIILVLHQIRDQLSSADANAAQPVKLDQAFARLKGSVDRAIELFDRRTDYFQGEHPKGAALLKANHAKMGADFRQQVQQATTNVADKK